MDIGGTYKLGPRWSLYFYARNILNAPRVVIEKNGANPWITYGYFTDGTNWTGSRSQGTREAEPSAGNIADASMLGGCRCCRLRPGIGC